jgi:hypothetical protein
MPNPVIRADSLSITAVQPDHIESIRVWRNEQMDVLRQSSPIEYNEQLAYFDSEIWPAMERTHPHQILVSIYQGEERVGYGGLVHIEWSKLQGEISFLLNPVHTNNAARYRLLFSGFLALIRVLAFRDLSLVRLFTETYDIRPLHIEILESAGFTAEKRVKNHVHIHGRAVDSLIHGYIRDAIKT